MGGIYSCVYLPLNRKFDTSNYNLGLGPRTLNLEDSTVSHGVVQLDFQQWCDNFDIIISGVFHEGKVMT